MEDVGSLVTHMLGIGQLGALLGIAWRAGQLVQSFRDHVREDERLFGLMETRLAHLERKI